MKTAISALILATTLVGGCTGVDTSLMPMAVGDVWTYSVRTSGEAEFVESVKVIRPIPVGEGMGYELNGRLGFSRLAWQDGQLVAEALAGVRLTPPLPLLDANQSDQEWSGWISAATLDGFDNPMPAKGLLSHRSENLTLGGRSVSTVVSVLSVRSPRLNTEITTWFERDVGIVRQEQRTNGRFDIGLEWLASTSS